MTSDNLKALIITHQEAREVDGVIDFVRQNGISVTRWNLCQYPEKLQHSDNAVSSRFHAGWIHNYPYFSFASTHTGLSYVVAAKECAAFWDGVFWNLKCDWINSPENIRNASNKLTQLKIADELGVRTPKYLVTNDSEAAHRFIAENDPVVVKSLSTGFLRYGKEEIKCYTRDAKEVLPSLGNSLKLSPAIFQEKISRRFELRITVINDQCFTVCFDAKGIASTFDDIRQLDFDLHEKRFSVSYDFPQLEALSLELMKALGLSYGGLDWIVDEGGQYFFLECNPLGSFKWYELRSGLDITSAIGEAIIRTANGHAQ